MKALTVKQSVIIISLMWTVTSGTQLALGIHLGIGTLAVFLFLLTFTQFILLIRTFRPSFLKDEKKSNVRDPSAFVRSSYLRCSVYLFVSAVFEAFLLGRSSLLTSSLTPLFYEAWVGHVGLVGAGIIRYWSLSLGHSKYSGERAAL